MLLTKAQLSRKASLEKALKPCLPAFGRVGAALAQIGGEASIADYLRGVEIIRAIHAEKLYRPQTWVQWCKTVTGYTSRNVESYLQAAPVMAEFGSFLRVSSAVILAKWPPELRAEVATADDVPTAAELDSLTAVMLGAATPEERRAIVRKSFEEFKAKNESKRAARQNGPDRIGGTVKILREVVEVGLRRAAKLVIGEGPEAEQAHDAILAIAGQIGPVIQMVEAVRRVAA